MQPMHKALTQMNLQIHHVISDITGLTGRAIVDAILAGQREAQSSPGAPTVTFGKSSGRSRNVR